MSAGAGAPSARPVKKGHAGGGRGEGRGDAGGSGGVTQMRLKKRQRTRQGWCKRQLEIRVGAMQEAAGG